MMKSLLAANRSEKDSFGFPTASSSPSPSGASIRTASGRSGRKHQPQNLALCRMSTTPHRRSTTEQRSIFRSYGGCPQCSADRRRPRKSPSSTAGLNPVDFQRTILHAGARRRPGLLSRRARPDHLGHSGQRKATIWSRKKYITLSIGPAEDRASPAAYLPPRRRQPLRQLRAPGLRRQSAAPAADRLRHPARLLPASARRRTSPV